MGIEIILRRGIRIEIRTRPDVPGPEHLAVSVLEGDEGVPVLFASVEADIVVNEPGGGYDLSHLRRLCRIAGLPKHFRPVSFRLQAAAGFGGDFFRAAAFDIRPEIPLAAGGNDVAVGRPALAEVAGDRHGETAADGIVNRERDDGAADIQGLERAVALNGNDIGVAGAPYKFFVDGDFRQDPERHAEAVARKHRGVFPLENDGLRHVIRVLLMVEALEAAVIPLSDGEAVVSAADKAERLFSAQGDISVPGKGKLHFVDHDVKAVAAAVHNVAPDRVGAVDETVVAVAQAEVQIGAVAQAVLIDFGPFPGEVALAVTFRRFLAAGSWRRLPFCPLFYIKNRFFRFGKSPFHSIVRPFFANSRVKLVYTDNPLELCKKYDGYEKSTVFCFAGRCAGRL